MISNSNIKSSTLTKEQLDTLVGDFISAIGSNRREELGYNSQVTCYLIYGTSKAALIALTRIEAREWSGAQNVLILSVTPGLCKTDLSNHAPGARSAELGADSVSSSRVNTPANELENGQFYEDGQQKPQSSACKKDLSHLSKKQE